MRHDARDIVMGEVSFQGIPALYSELHIERKTVPKELHVYELRRAQDDPFMPVQIKDRVEVNFYGTLITTKPLRMPREGIFLNGNPFDFKNCEKMNLERFMGLNRIKLKALKIPAREGR